MKSAETEQARQELAEERCRLASLLQEMEELHFNASVEQSKRQHADERAHCAEGKCSAMAKWLSKADEDRTIISDQLTKVCEERAEAEEELRVEQERMRDLAGELMNLQMWRQSTKRIWSEEVNRLCGQLLVL